MTGLLPTHLDRGASVQRFEVLDTWRGVCALFVALLHFNVQSHLFGLPIIRNASIFVDFFFLLSGFVISHAYERRLGTRESTAVFVLRRFGRLWPLHVATLSIFVGLDLAKFGAVSLLGVSVNTSPAVSASRETAILSVLANVALVQALGLYSTFRTLQWNYPSWSISVEFYTYLIFAAVCFVPGRYRTYGTMLLCALGGVVIILFSPTGLRQGEDLALFRCLYGFFAGMLVYRTFTRTRLTRYTNTHEIVAVAAVLLFTSVPNNSPIAMAAPLVFGYVIWVFAHGGGGISRLLSNRIGRTIGDWSYSIYMVHAAIIMVVFLAVRVLERTVGLQLIAVNPEDLNRQIVMPSMWMGDAVFVLYIPAVLFAASLTYRWIEVPGRNYFNALAKKIERRQMSLKATA
jgi:peptidoglycan/LPS O-acetylase OafA/YrhL